MSTKPQALLIDYGGVVADHYCEPATGQLGKLLGVAPEMVESFVSEKTPHGRAYRLDQMRPEEFWEIVRVSANAMPFSWPLAQELWAATYRPNHDVLALLRELKRGGIRIAILSNMDRLREESMRALLDWDRYCEMIYCSWMVGHMKPDAGFYTGAIRRFGYLDLASAVVCVDDRRTHTDAAAAVGCIGVRFSNATQLRADLDGLFRSNTEDE